MNWLLYTRAEFDTRDELRAIGIEAHAPEKIEMLRRGTDRRPRPYSAPLVPRLVLFRATPAEYHKAASKGALRGTMQILSDRMWQREITPWLKACADELAAIRARIEAGEQIDQYQPGDRLRLPGHFADVVAKFVGTCQRADEMFPRLLVEAEMLGRTVNLKVDPLGVKRE